MNFPAMDDLDHSVHIAERDWNSFYEESEECNLVQAELAGIDDSGLSDNDEPANPPLEVFTTKCAEDACLGCSTASPLNHEEEEGAATAINQSQHDILTSEQESSVSLEEETQTQVSHPVPVPSEVPKEETQTQVSHPVPVPSEVPKEETQTQVSHPVPVPTEVPKEVDGVDQEDVDVWTCSPDVTQTSETQSEAEKHGGEADCPAETDPTAERKEKERWFVTVNDSPVQLRCRPGAACQKKKRKKKTSRRTARSVAGWEPYLSQSETEAETERCEESKSDLTEMTEKCRSTVSQLPERLVSSENIHIMPQDQALDLKTFDLPDQQTLCKKQENDCRSANLSVDHLNQNKQFTTQSPLLFSASENPPSIQISKLSSEKQNNPLPQTHKRIADNSSPKCPVIRLNETTSADSSKTEENPLGNPCANPLDPPHTTDLLPKRLATFNTDGGEAPSPLPEDSETKAWVSEESLTEALNPARPVFAISSFWDEMEKLTINDILHLRCGDDQSPSTDAYHLHESISLPSTYNSSPLDPTDTCEQDMDALDNADSDYFTHLDDSKPDRSSCEFSTFSDFDEDLLQMINTSCSASPEPQENLREQAQTLTFSDLPYSQAALAEEEMELARRPEPESEFPQLYFDTGIPLLLCSDAESSSQTISPAGSEYSMSALESEIVREACFTNVLQDEGGNQMLFFPYEETQDPSLLLAECDIMMATQSPLSTSSFLEDSHVISFTEMTCKDASIFNRPSSDDSLQTYSEKLSVPEAYDYFFSDFDERNLFFPLKHGLKGGEAQTVPIFSCSRSLVRDLTFPEVEQFIESEEEDNWAPIRVISRFSVQQGSGSSSSAAAGVYLYSGRSWKSMLSLRRTRLARMRSSWCQRAKAWMSPGMFFRALRRSTSVADVTRGTCSSLQVFHLGDPILRKLALEQIRLPDQPNAFKKKRFLFSMRQSDMCLVCIAFASWVLKSTNLQSRDTWKAALLANVSAISAIQYLRRYKRYKTAEDEP
ncbi:uncharacterized protein LOC125301545 isoform X2 [Alosa alosa]|uniref:uncharacterized protein LOC125301545 isoform X2 n=1 Tax=Alosa alosa TaxID=278164 RepID=UPI002015052C|nr:uncharacterized protein LOC125301545 isoform X2 [Alosa alosa]